MNVTIGDLGAESLSTEELAELLHVQAQTIRAAHHRHGSYLGMKPIKLPSRLLLWPRKQVDELLKKKEQETGRIVHAPDQRIVYLEQKLSDLGRHRTMLLASLLDIKKHVTQDHYAWKIADDALSAVEQDLLR